MDRKGLSQKATYKQEWLLLGKAEDAVIGLLAVARADDAIGLATRRVDGAADVVVDSHVLLGWQLLGDELSPDCKVKSRRQRGVRG